MVSSQVVDVTRRFMRKHFPTLTKLMTGKQSSPIFLLPPEILIHIFSLVCDLQSHHFCPAAIHPDRLSEISRPFFKKPVILSHICSYWRHIAVNLPSLWSHIDLFSDQFYDQMLSTRLKTYAARSSQALLDIHFILRPSKFHIYSLTLSGVLVDYNSEKTIFPFLKAAAPRIRSLSIMARSSPPIGSKYCSLVLTKCFANSLPLGKLTEVSIEAAGSIAFDLLTHSYLQEFRVEESVAEAVWFPVTILNLTQCNVSWESKAYHGLTELRLHDCRSVNASALISILQSSPQLRRIELDNFQRPVPGTFFRKPIPLVNLEVLVLVGVSDSCLGTVLQVIAPGSKQLSLSISNLHDNYRFTSKPELQSLIARSNVLQLCVNRVEKYTQLVDILSLMPSVHILAIDSFSCKETAEDSLLSPAFTLDVLYIIRSRELSLLAQASIEGFVKRHQVQKLIFWWCDFTGARHGKHGERRVSDNLCTACPVVELIPDEEPNPIDGWYLRGLHNYF